MFFYEHFGANILGSNGYSCTCDMYCPQISGIKGNNFWKSSCFEKIGNRDIATCRLGCEEAAKHPELKAKMDKVKAEYEESRKRMAAIEKEDISRYNKLRYKKGLLKKPKTTKKQKAEIITLYKEGCTLDTTSSIVGCSRTTVKLYRKLFKEGAMDENGNVFA